MRTRNLAFVAALWAGLSASAAFASSEAAGRRHAAKANKLAAQNKCRRALPEFHRAYNALKDPSLLFNRAECERKLGMVEDALNDYERFLAAMPDAPNRASVESRIAALRAMKDDRAGERAPVEKAPATPKSSQGATGPAPSASSRDGGRKEDAAPPRRAEKWTD